MSVHKSMSRRAMLRWSAGALLAGGLWPGRPRAGDASSSQAFHFLVMNDLHYFDHRCGDWFERVIQEIKARPERIDFCFLAGDLSEQGHPEQLGPVRDLFGTMGLPIYVVIGNHDHRSPEDRKAFLDLFPRSLNYVFEHRGWQIIGIDTSHGTAAQVSAQPATLHWLDDTLPRLDKRRPTVLVTHFPLGPWVPYRVQNASGLLERFKPFNVQAIYNGHFHGFTERRVEHAIITTNRCCSFHRKNHDGTREKGYFLCEARDGQVQRTFVQTKVASNGEAPGNAGA